MVPWSLIGQEGGGGFDLIWILLPLLCCVLTMTQRGGERQAEVGAVEDSWYTPQEIGTAYEAIEAEAGEWRRRAEERRAEREKSTMSRLLGSLGGGRAKERFVVDEAKPPRLYQMSDETGPIIFELTEVEGGGTVVKATYDRSLKSRVAKFKADQPLKIPATPVGSSCPSCGKPVLREFKVCPYCGEKLIEE